MVKSSSRKGIVGNRTDPAWKYGVQIEGPGSQSGTGKSYVYLKCNFCSNIYKGGVRRLKEHLACTHKDAKPCDKVPEEVKQEMILFLKKKEAIKLQEQQQFNEMMDSGSYFGGGVRSGVEGDGSFSSSRRGIRGPMDRFMMNAGDNSMAGTFDKDTSTLPSSNLKEHRDQVCLDIGRFFFENGIPFNAIRSPSFANMCRSIGNYGRGLKIPTMYELTSWILQQELNTTKGFDDDVRRTWNKIGVSILSDGWKDMRGRTLINFLVNNPQGTVFLKSIDASNVAKDATLLFNLLDDVVEEVGEDNVVQVITDNASNYKLAGQMLMEKRKHIYWTPCAAHCIDLMLEKIGELPQHKQALRKARKVSHFIYNHTWVLSLMRKFTGRDLLRPATTRFATAFLTLQSLVDLKEPLERMFSSDEWNKSMWTKKAEGKEVKKIILNDKSFWRGVIYALKTTKPLVCVLRMVDSEKMPAMGFIYNAMDEAKEKIAKNLGDDLCKYKEIWDIIDEKWDFQLHRPLHAAAYMLNPQIQYGSNPSTHLELKLGLYECLDKLVEDIGDKMKCQVQLNSFLGKDGLFGIQLAQGTYNMQSPDQWWAAFGDQTPELQKFAIKVLSLTCSSSGCERNWSTYNQVHTKRRNRLSTIKLNSLVYIMYNKKMKDKHLKKKSLKDEDDPLIFEDVPSDDEWIVESDEETTLNDDDVDPRIGLLMENVSNRERASTSNQRTRKSQAKDKGKSMMRSIDEEDEWEEISSDNGEEDDDLHYDDFFDGNDFLDN